MKRLKSHRLSCIVIQIFVLYALFICVSSGYLYIQYRDDIKKFNQIEEKNEKSEVLILSKKTDAKVIENSENYQMDYDNFNDFISDEELSQIKKIDGIKDIKSYYNIYLSDENFQIYENDEFVKEVKNELTINNQTINGHIYLVGYNSFQNIQHQGKEINGVYLNHQFQQLLNDDVPSKTLTMTCHIPSSMKYQDNYVIKKEDNEKETLKGYDIQTVEEEVSFSVEGILDEDEYNTAAFDSELIIYAPTYLIEDILTMYGQNPDTYQTRQYMIHCTALQKETIKKEIQKLNSLYVVEDEFENIYVSHDGSLKNCFISCVLIAIFVVIELMVMNHHMDNKKDFKEEFQKNMIISINITMLIIFIMTQSFYYIVLWIIPAILLIFLEYMIFKKCFIR